MASPARYQTLAADNQFRFTCPIFNVDVRFSQCSRVRDAVYNGAKLEVRRGCQACVKDSKCPASEIIRKIAFGGGNVPDDYGSSAPVAGKIRKDVLEKIAPVIVMQRTMDSLAVPDAERQLIASSNDRIRKLAGLAALPSDDAPPRFNSAAKKRAPARKKAPQNDNKINQAAATGDLAVAVSQ